MDFTNKDAALNLRYGIVIEVAFAIKLLEMGGSPAEWLAYFLLATSAICLLAGFGWYLLWAIKRRFALLYLAGVFMLVPWAILAVCKWFGVAPAEWLKFPAVLLFLIGAAYCAWRI